MKNLILLGAPGSGKGTIAKKLVSELGFVQVSTGDLFRAEIASGSDLGNEIKSIIEKGNLVEDSLTARLLKKNIDLEKHAYIFDGFPRNAAQAKILDEEILCEKDAIAIYFDIDFSVIEERIVNRRSCRDCGAVYNLLWKTPKCEGKCDACGGEIYQRNDDKPEVIQNRLAVFSKTIEPILAHYQSKGVLHRVNANLGSDSAFAEIKAILNA